MWGESALPWCHATPCKTGALLWEKGKTGRDKPLEASVILLSSGAPVRGTGVELVWKAECGMPARLCPQQWRKVTEKVGSAREAGEEKLCVLENQGVTSVMAAHPHFPAEPGDHGLDLRTSRL